MVERDAAVRAAAWKMLVRLALSSRPAPLVMTGREPAFVRHLLDDAAPEEVERALRLSLEEIAGGCIRLIRSGYAARKASRRA